MQRAAARAKDARRRLRPAANGVELGLHRPDRWLLEGIARMTEDEMRKRLEILRVEHRDLDAAIAALAENPATQLQVARLKKRKLLLKDQIALLEDALIPDIIA
ncbi:hypothetical protein J2X37_001162 [Croceicoccus sp. BE223]|nr:hypothetical protein [Croceicoccus sp. BE223]